MTEKPSKSEEEYFARQERQRREEEAIRRRQGEREARRRLHFMKCPKCGADLETTLFRDVQIERCTECHGAWLDAGELEKLAGHEPHVLSDFFLLLKKRRSG